MAFLSSPKSSKALLVASLVAAGSMVGFQAAAAEVPDPKVVTTVKPVQSLVAAVIGSDTYPHRIVPDNASPHGYALKPSDAKAIQEMDLLVWIGPNLESFLVSTVDQVSSKKPTLQLSAIPELTRLPLREGGDFDEHDHDHGHGHDDHGHDDHGHGHDDHGHDDHGHKGEHAHDDHGHKGHDDHGHDDHGHKGHDDHGHDDHGHEDHGHKGHDDHGHDDHGHGEGEFDTHVWLDPDNAKLMLLAIAEQLSAIAPQNEARYRANADATIKALGELTHDIKHDLEGLENRPFVAFHDAYQYFEKRFGVSAAGTITVNPEVPPGAKSLREIKEKIERLGVVCVFSEPQFSGRVVDVVVQGTGAKKSVLDPLGKDIPEGPDQYMGLIKQMAGSFKDCLTP